MASDIESKKKADDLTAIEGIGPTYAEALAKIDVQSFADLAEYKTSTELQLALLEQAKVNVPLSRIENSGSEKGSWISQAQEHLGLRRQRARQTEPSRKADPSEKSWKDHASFSFRSEFVTDDEGRQLWWTRVYHDQSGEEAWFLPKWVDWICEQADIPVIEKPKEPGPLERIDPWAELYFRYKEDEQGKKFWKTFVFQNQIDKDEFQDLDPARWVSWILSRMKLPPGAIGAVSPMMEGEPESEQRSSNGGETMEEIKIKRGGREVSFKKVDNAFAVRLKQGKATSEEALESTVGRSKAVVQHLDSVAAERMEIFTVQEADQLEEAMDKLRESPAADVVSHVYTLDDSAESSVVPGGMMTLQFKADTTKEQREKVLADYGLAVIEDIDYMPDAYTVRLTDASTMNPLKIAYELQQMDEVLVAEPDISFKVALQHVPTDTLYPKQWHLRNRGDLLGLRAGADVKAEEAWDISQGARSITVCVIDDGFALKHPDFDVPGKIVAPRDFGQEDFDPNPVFADDNHGTACAGVAVAEENGLGVVGLAPGCSLMPVRMSGWLTDETVAGYFKYAMNNGASIISCSWSAAAWNFPLSTKMQAIIHHAATNGRDGKGCVILFAAGNENRPLNGTKDGRISYQGFALHPDVIAVAASNSFDQRSSYSNYGPEIAICAPSSGFPGRGIVTTDRPGLRGYSADDYSNDFGGTSSATPLAAGLAALMLSVYDALTASEVKQIIMETADKIDQAGGNYVDGHSKLYGHGRINAYESVKRAEKLTNEETPDGGEKPEEPPAEIDEVTVDISSVQLAPLGFLLLAVVDFNLSGPDSQELLANQAEYRIEVSIAKRNGKERRPAAQDQSRLEPGELSYTHKLQFPLPSPGSYKLLTSVTMILPDDRKVEAKFEGPNFRVR